MIDGDLLDVNDPTQVTDAGRMLADVHEALAAYPAQVGRGRPKSEEQLVHNDFRSANVLHDGTRITAVLDLEEVTYETRVADLARAAVLLGTRYRNWRPAPEDVRELFIASYDAHAKVSLTKAERDALDGLIAANLAKPWWSAAAHPVE